MKFLIIGHSVVDKIIDNKGVSIKPGGIFYTTVSFLSQLNKDDNLFLCTSIDESNEELFMDYYQSVEKDYIYKVDSIPRVELKIDNVGERKESYSQISQNLIIPEENLNQFDGILINMISGFDISVSQLQHIRKNYDGLIYFDVHTLSRGVDKNFNRNFKKIEKFNTWAACIDILQTNESELHTLSKNDNETQIIEELLNIGVKQVIVTRAERGATIFFRDNGITKNIYREAFKMILINKVGCGDVFGAVYFYNYKKNKNVFLALERANLFAGLSTTYSHPKEFLNLRIDGHKVISKK